MKNKILVAFFLLSSAACFSQTEITWWDLSRINYTEKYFPSYGEYFLYPEFSERMKSLEGKKVSITGFFLDIDPSGKLFILSKNPMASCFFVVWEGQKRPWKFNLNRNRISKQMIFFMSPAF